MHVWLAAKYIIEFIMKRKALQRSEIIKNLNFLRDNLTSLRRWRNETFKRKSRIRARKAAGNC
jgi:hypothetical protein